MTPSRLSITAADQRFRVQLEQAEDGWLAYPEAIHGVVIGSAIPPQKPWRICNPPIASIATPSAPAT